MTQEVTNFARFYAAFARLPHSGDREEFRRSIVHQYTWGRTDSLKEMSRKEYQACCAALEALSGMHDELRHARSRCLKLMQVIGIDTSDWGRINGFCRDTRIAGKPFARLSPSELEELCTKLRAIHRKGGLKAGGKTAPSPDALICLLPSSHPQSIN